MEEVETTTFNGSRDENLQVKLYGLRKHWYIWNEHVKDVRRFLHRFWTQFLNHLPIKGVHIKSGDKPLISDLNCRALNIVSITALFVIFGTYIVII